MFLVGITVFFVLLGLGFFVYGAIGLSKYAFRLGTGPGLLTLLFPPYTFYFAIFKLEEEGKSWPTSSWLFGLVVATLVTVAFWPDLSAVAKGDMERFQQDTGTAAMATEQTEEANAAEKAAEEEAAKQVEEEKKAREAAKSEGEEGEESAEGEEGEDGAAEGDTEEAAEAEEQ